MHIFKGKFVYLFKIFRKCDDLYRLSLKKMYIVNLSRLIKKKLNCIVSWDGMEGRKQLCEVYNNRNQYFLG